MAADGPRTTNESDPSVLSERGGVSREGEDRPEPVGLPAARFINGQFLAREDRDTPFAADWL